jgi:hypothetical protein
MAYPTESNLETAIGDIETTLRENPQLRNAPAAWQSWQEVVGQLIGPVTADAGYTDLTPALDTSNYKDV